MEEVKKHNILKILISVENYFKYYQTIYNERIKDYVLYLGRSKSFSPKIVSPLNQNYLDSASFKESNNETQKIVEFDNNSPSIFISPDGNFEY